MIEVEIYIVSLSKKYDFFLDENTHLKHIVEEVSDIVSQKEQTKIQGDISKIIVYKRTNKKILSNNQTLYEQNISNGDVLYLI